MYLLFAVGCWEELKLLPILSLLLEGVLAKLVSLSTLNPWLASKMAHF